jgi:hypothetical protein
VNAARVASLKVLPLSIAVLSLSSLGALGSPAGATSSATGVISGHVDECGPGPIPVTPTNHPPAPQPVVVTVRHGERTVAYEQVVMTTSLPWTGTFSFNVPVGEHPRRKLRSPRAEEQRAEADHHRDRRRRGACAGPVGEGRAHALVDVDQRIDEHERLQPVEAADLHRRQRVHW